MFGKIRQMLASGKPVSSDAEFEAEAAAIRESWVKKAPSAPPRGHPLARAIPRTGQVTVTLPASNALVGISSASPHASPHQQHALQLAQQAYAQQTAQMAMQAQMAQQNALLQQSKFNNQSGLFGGITPSGSSGLGNGTGGYGDPYTPNNYQTSPFDPSWLVRYHMERAAAAEQRVVEWT
jgi:hypothetical protein